MDDKDCRIQELELEVRVLRERQQAHLELIRHMTTESIDQDQADELRGQVAVLMAAVGTLKHGTDDLTDSMVAYRTLYTERMQDLEVDAVTQRHHAALADIESNWDHETSCQSDVPKFSDHEPSQCRCCTAGLALNPEGYFTCDCGAAEGTRHRPGCEHHVPDEPCPCGAAEGTQHRAECETYGGDNPWCGKCNCWPDVCCQCHDVYCDGTCEDIEGYGDEVARCAEDGDEPIAEGRTLDEAAEDSDRLDDQQDQYEAGSGI